MAVRLKSAPILGSALALIVLIGNAVLAYINITEVVDNDREVARSYAVQTKLEELLSTLKEAESGQRGYVITANLSYREPYNRALDARHRQMEELRRLFGDNPDQLKQLKKLDDLIDQKIAEMQRVIDRYPADFDEARVQALSGFHKEILTMVRARSFEAARSVVMTNEGFDKMRQIRSVLSDMEAEESRLLHQRQADAHRSLVIAQVSNIVGVVAGVAMVILAYYLIQRDRTAELTLTNRTLKVEVEQRTLAEARGQAVAEELQRSNRELQQFAAIASHDLQEPLRKIQAFGDRLKSKCYDTLGEAGQDYLQRMQAAAARMATLITDLLTYSRVATRQQAFQPVDLERISQEVIVDLEARIQQTQGTIDIGPLPTLEGDPLQIRQLFQNLLGNALKFHKPDIAPVIHVRSRAIAGSSPDEPPVFHEISVQDNGIGFEEIYLDRIFGFFQRLHGRNEYEGTGMGLAICRRIVERHGGHITARSTPGEGSTFLITLPQSQPKEVRKDE